MPRPGFSPGLLGLVLALLLVGCAGSDAMRVEVYEPASAHVSYGYGGYAAGGSAWSGYSGTAPTGPLPPTLRPVAVVPVDVLHLPAPTLLRGDDGQLTFDAGLLPPGALQLTEPGAHPMRHPANFLLHR